MKKWRYLFIAAVLIYSTYLLIPTARFYAMSSDKRKSLSETQRDKYVNSTIKLGLDLQGGMHLVVEIDDSKLSADAKKDAMNRVIKILRNRVDQFGVAEPVIQKQGDRRIIIELPGLQNADRAKELIGRTAQLEFRFVRGNDELARVLKDLDVALKGVEVTPTGVDTTGVGEGEGTPTDTLASQNAADTVASETAAFDSLIPEIPGEEEMEVPVKALSEESPFTSNLHSGSGEGAVVVEEHNRPIVDALLATEQAQRVMPLGAVFLWGADLRPIQGGGQGYVLYLCDTKAILTGAHLVNATTRPNPDDPSRLDVGFQLDREGAIIFARITGDNIGRRLAIVLDGLVASAPEIQGKIPGGEGRITGGFTDEEAGDLAIVLRAGALPVPIHIIEERTVGPTLGRDSIALGIRAAIYGFVLVLIFMILYYRASGLLACAALLLNLVLILAALAQLRAALTLPGIAGLILTIGMSVDANVLIFERIREELAKAKTVRSAIDSGYDRAFTTIFDANLTTLITAFVLWQFGTGPIKGFATVLSIGIIASMFTALLCTRVVYDMITARWNLRKLSI